MKRSFFIQSTLTCLLTAAAGVSYAQSRPLSEEMASTAMHIWKDSLNLDPASPKPVKWAYDQGVILEGIDGIWRRTGDGEYFKYMQKSMDFFVTKEGGIRTYKQEDYNIDNVKNGRSLLTLYKVTGQMKYFKAATLLWEQLKKQPRTREGGFWHKKIYPNQMWLDGLYMGEPFYAEYASLVKDEQVFEDIANQFIYMEQHARDAKTGLLYHGWDESKAEQWANKTTGTSPNFWGRAMGWYGMALVDVLDYFPENHPKRKALLGILDRLVMAVGKYQDPSSGLWYDVLDKAQAKGNYQEASASCMFVYTVAKGVRKGYLAAKAMAIAKKGYAGIKKEFIEPGAHAGQVNLKGTVSVSGLGGKPYRDGSFEYYIKERVITNDPKGVGAFLLASNEMEIAALPKRGLGKTVVLDSYFNNETRKDQSGNEVSWHYKWEELANGGFSMWGGQFNHAGFKTSTLYAAPSAEDLKKASAYIIVDPDTEKETKDPKYILPEHIQLIADWVKAGGVLVLMANDTGNVELEHFNHLARAFGVQFNLNSKGRVINNNYPQGEIRVAAGNPVLKKAKQLYIKEYSSLKLLAPARSVLKDKDGDDVMAVSKLGKGSVFIIGDPWLYNEYVDGRKLPAAYDNFTAGADLVNWIAEQLPAGKR